MLVLVHIELTVNLSYDYEVGFKSRNTSTFFQIMKADYVFT